MRRERIRKNRRRLYLTLTGIGAVVIFIGVFVWLVLRGAKVQGPTASSSATSISISSTVTSSFKSGTYTASGDVTDTNGDHHDLTVYVKLTSSKTYTRLIILDAGSQPQIINDTGDVKQKKGKLTLSSEHANVYTYASAKTYKHNQPTTTVEYASEGATGTVHDYTTALKKELNNTITLKGKTPHNYRYLTTSLPLQRSKKKLLSLDDFKTKQTASSSESSSATSNYSYSEESQYSSEPTSSQVSVAPTPSAAPSVESEHSQSNNTGQAGGTAGNHSNGSTGTSTNNGGGNGQSTQNNVPDNSQTPSSTPPSSTPSANSNH
ncbi:hypothetical protein KTT66_05240 [Lacticaseibacillus casei]|jgi:hypothetical protein|uniref:Cell surface protein n=1 Tax=Lacticaseibacillus huelsenbergensis TaxID=3035291 RepID=A0ABY8DMW9_9LACO|nr:MULTISPECIES: hypothetical protein [Lacticaseibacillus]MDG3062579.1 hypothetical protein [Lacticaseibacillus sp. BCRC 81376]QVI38392.1 hypothetical protein KGS74_05460 [Lacticaseibacillus casei]QXG60204.1 hypothetical protein KTT66_05240 [Lacticaseibacillus casei]WFB38319.1 hypothetical protein LHUE1_001801 [Lacticaseibacillus huelsenbergensis]WFB42743.1 hypothetical protein LHUE2_000752 [Lacticaseibacillus huelsenbergensis]